MTEYNIITTQAQQITAAEPAINEGLLVEFVTWINRSEKTTRTYLKNLKQFLAWMKWAGVTQPTRADILNFQQFLSEEHEGIILDPTSAQGWTYRTDGNGAPVVVKYRANTVRQYLRSVCQLFTWLADCKGYANIARNIRLPKVDATATHRRQALPLSAVSEIEHSIEHNSLQRAEQAKTAEKDTAGRIQRTDEQGKRLYAMYLLAVNAGLRTIEISRAKIKDLETTGGQTWLYVWGKGHTEPDRKQPLAAEVVEAIKEYIAARKDKPTGNSPLFVSTGNRSGGKAIATTTISTMLKRAMQQAGYDSERLTAHSLRHTTATGMLKASHNNIYDVQQYMRHNDPRTTEIYTHETEEAQSTRAGMAKQLYNIFHGIQTDARESLEGMLDKMTAEQIEKLEQIAAAFV